MKLKSVISLAALLSLATTVACSQTPTPSAIGKTPERFNQTVPGSYIVKASGGGDAVIRRVFDKYGVTFVRPLGNEQFELRLSQDPGLEVLEGVVKDSDGAITAIQPNFVYHAN